MRCSVIRRWVFSLLLKRAEKSRVVRERYSGGTYSFSADECEMLSSVFFDDLWELSGSAFVVLGGPVHLMVGIDPVGLWRCRNMMA